MKLSTDSLRLLRVIAESEGEWDIRNIDYGYYSDPNSTADIDLIGSIKQLVDLGYVAEVRAVTDKVGWTATDLGLEELRSQGLNIPYVILALRSGYPDPSVSVESFAPDVESAEQRVDKLNSLGLADLVYVCCVARGLRNLVDRSAPRSDD